MQIRDYETHDGNDRFSIYYDVAELFWPQDFGRSNHDADTVIRERLLAIPGCERVESTYGTVSTPFGDLLFDSESGGFCAYASKREPLIFLFGIIRSIEVERDRLRELAR